MTPEVLNEATKLCIQVYSKKDDDFDDLPTLRAHNFLTHKSASLLKLLPPTEDAFTQHVKRSALATIIDKRSHIATPTIPPYTHFGWTGGAEIGTPLVPKLSTSDPWPQQMSKALSCNCKKGCARNCSCAKRGVSCYVGCRCTGAQNKCSRHQYIEEESE